MSGFDASIDTGGASVNTGAQAPGNGGGSIQKITSTGGSIAVTNPTGPIVNLETVGGGLLPIADQRVLGNFSGAPAIPVATPPSTIVPWCRSGRYYCDGTEASFDAALASANANPFGGTIELGRYILPWTTPKVITGNGVRITGNGPGQSFIQLDSVALAGADAITINQRLYAHFDGLSFLATVPRAAGACIKVLGVNNISANPAQQTRQYTIVDCEFFDQFDSLNVVDGAGGLGAWGGYIMRSEIINPSANGHGIFINTPSGGQHYMTDIKIYGPTGGTAATHATAGVRIRGCNDVECHNVNTIYTQYGLLIDPPVGQNTNAMIFRNCFWDSPYVRPCYIVPAGGSTHLVIFDNNWFGVNGSFNPTGNAFQCQGAFQNIYIKGGWFIALNGGILVDGTGGGNNFHVSGRPMITGNNGANIGFHATGNLQHFSFDGNVTADSALPTTAPATGIQVDLGCNFYELRAAINQCITPIVDNGGPNKIVQNL